MTEVRPGVLLACEMGGGRGHVAKLAQILRALGPRVRAVAALGHRAHGAELTVHGAKLLPAPWMGMSRALREDPARSGNATWGCYLAACGMASPEVVARHLDFWRRLIIAEDISLLVTDYAPLAMLAARGLQEEGWEIRIISAGTGYGVPPADLPHFPQLLPDLDRVVHPEAQVLAGVNAVLEARGIMPLAALPQIYCADLALPATLPWLDPYRSWRDPGDLVPPIVNRPQLAGDGDEVFVYFSRDEMEEEALIAALEALDLPKRGYLPGARPELRARLAASGMLVEEAPVPVDQIAMRSRMVIHPAPHGTIVTAALAGLPQLGLPGHAEQLAHGRAAEAAGILQLQGMRQAEPAAILDRIRSIHADQALRRHSRDFARALRETFPEDPMADLAERLRPELEAAGRFLTG